MPRGVKRMPGDKAPRDRIIMVKLARKKRVELPNGRVFYAGFKRATLNELPANVTFRRNYTQRAAPKGKRRKRRDRGFKSALRKAFGLAN